MGLFDRLIDVKLTCPYCGRGGDIEIQTKDLPNPFMSRYHVRYPEDDEEKGLLAFLPRGEPAYAGPKLRYVDAFATCRGPLCDMLGRMKRLVEGGYVGWSGRSFDVRYRVDEEGFVVGPAEVVERDDTPEGDIVAAFEAKLREDEELGRRFQEAVERYHGDAYVALTMQRWEDTEHRRRKAASDDRE